jgi:hypothetical protein
MLPRVAVGAVSIPVVAGFVALGTAVVVVRSARELAREAWSHVPWWRTREGGPESETDAA